jgi:hypothetical protein
LGETSELVSAEAPGNSQASVSVLAEQRLSKVISWPGAARVTDALKSALGRLLSGQSIVAVLETSPRSPVTLTGITTKLVLLVSSFRSRPLM